MSEQRYTWYPDGDTGPCYINHWPVERQLAPSWFRGNGQGGNVLVGSYTWSDGERSEVYRDDLRKGWHVVPMGVRYVAVQGVKAGQRCTGNYADPDNARHVAARFTADHTIDGTGPVADMDVPDRWTVLALHDLADHRTTGASRTADVCTVTMGRETTTTLNELSAAIGRQLGAAPRFVVKPAPSMREGEPYVNAWDITPFRDEAGTTADAQAGADEYNRLGVPDFFTPLRWAGQRGAVPVVDTHSPEWKAFQAKAEVQAAVEHVAKSAQKAMDAMKATTEAARSYEAAKPSGPSDTEIVEAWTGWMRDEAGVKQRSSPGHVIVSFGKDWRHVPIAECRAAWSRELKRRSEATKEAERRRVLGPIDDPEHA